METIRLAEIPVEVLWNYSETNRSKTSKKIELSEVSINSGSNYSLPIQLSIVGTNALLIDETNQIEAARQSGNKNVLVNVSVFLGDGKKIFFREMLKQFKPINDGLALHLRNLFL